MCCCDQPNINGQMGYKWQPSDPPSIRQPFPPPLEPLDEVLYDEPGRCGGIDSHCHHFMVVRRYNMVYLLFRHGGGAGRIRIHSYDVTLSKTLAALDTHARYWLLHTIYYAHKDGGEDERQAEENKWVNAAKEKRIKLRRRKGNVSVYFAPKIVTEIKV